MSLPERPRLLAQIAELLDRIVEPSAEALEIIRQDRVMRRVALLVFLALVLANTLVTAYALYEVRRLVALTTWVIARASFAL